MNTNTDSHGLFQERRPDSIYFAFGSNLHLGQMAKRCPESRYIGLARLHGYRFQINQRGYANVVPSRSDYVEGLIYLLSRTDEQRLDRNEGVPTAYQKHLLTVEVYTASVAHVGRAVSELAQSSEFPYSDSGPSEDFTRPRSSHNRPHSDLKLRVHHQSNVWSSFPWRHGVEGLTQYLMNPQSKIRRERATRAGFVRPRSLQETATYGQMTEALVYISRNFQKDGKPRDEYIDRMNAGIIDARKFGMSDFYINRCLRRDIPDRQLLDYGDTSAQHRSSRGRQSLQGDWNPARNYLPDRPIRKSHESKKSMTSAPTSRDKKGRQLEPESSDDDSDRDSDSDPAPYYPKGRTRDAIVAPRRSSSAVEDERRRPFIRSLSTVSRSTRLHRTRSFRRSRSESRPPSPLFVRYA